jgi:hypothetical protein
LAQKIDAALHATHVALSKPEQLMKQALPELERAAKSATGPKALQKRIAEELAKDPSAAWDEVLHRLVPVKPGRL